MSFKLQFVTVGSDGNSRRVLDTLVLDASLSEVHSSDADVTEFPVEEGSDISDNVRIKPQTLMVEAVISDFHLSNEGRATASSGGPFSAQRPNRADSTPIASASGQSFSTTLPGAVGNSKLMLAKLEGYQAQGTRIDVETGLKSYRNMVIKSLRTPRDKSIKNAVKVSIELTSIIIAQSQSAVIKQSEPKGQGETKQGQKTPTAADSGKENQSLLVRSQEVPEALKKGTQELIDALKARLF